MRFLVFMALGASSVAARSLNARNDIMCAVIGDSRVAGYKTLSGDTYPVCSNACFADIRCQSFSRGAGQCILYNTTVDQNFDWDSDSSYFFYDTGCEKINKQCGVIGYNALEDIYDYSDAAGLTNSACSKKCLSQPDCRSYAFGNGECLLYDVPVSGNFNGNSNSPYSFYDRSCLSSVSTTTTKTTTTSKTTTKQATSTGKTTTTTVKASTTTTGTVAKTSTTTVLISNQSYYCTAIQK